MLFLMQLLEDIDANKLPMFSNLPAPAIAKSYWKLGDDAMFRDLILAVRYTPAKFLSAFLES